MSVIEPCDMTETLSHIASGGRGLFQLGLAIEPIVNLGSLEGSNLYSECLARLLVNDTALLKGSEFVDDLERAGIISSLDEVIVGLVLDALEVDPVIRLGCNISPQTLANPKAWNRIIQKISERSWLAVRLTLEITESAPLDEIIEVADRLKRAQSYGCRLALDDFGASYAVAHRLNRVDVDWDILKLDRSCLGGLRKTPAGREGLAAMVSVARCLAPVVVVEGIETEEHLRAARVAGAQFGQGWMFEGRTSKHWADVSENASVSFARALSHNTAVGHHFRTPIPPVDWEPNRGHRQLRSRINWVGRMRAIITQARQRSRQSSDDSQ